MSRTRFDGLRLDNNADIQVGHVLDAKPDQGHNRGMSIQPSPVAPTVRSADAPFTPGERCLLATFVANSLHRLGTEAIERILVFGSRARGEGGEDSDLDLAVFVARDAHRTVARDLTDIAESIESIAPSIRAEIAREC